MDSAKETLKHRIEGLITKSGYKNLRRFHKAIVDHAGEDAITYSSLHNAINLTDKPHIRTLDQIASVLKIKISDLIKGTTAEPQGIGPASGYIKLNETSILKNLFRGLPFKPQVLRVEAHGTSTNEQKFFFESKCFRFIYILKGPVELVLKHKDREDEHIAFEKGDVYNFDSSILHHFKNDTGRFSEILIINFKDGIPWED